MIYFFNPKVTPSRQHVEKEIVKAVFWQSGQTHLCVSSLLALLKRVVHVGLSSYFLVNTLLRDVDMSMNMRGKGLQLKWGKTLV